MAKIKNIEAFCGFCAAVTKMEIAGETKDGPDATTRWAKCKKCKQKIVIDLADLKKEAKITLQDIKTEGSNTYSPAKSFAIGETIFHQKFNDFGIVLSKELSSDGKRVIIVDFQNGGKKKLLETITNN
jgi:hypothetical protein